MANLPSHILVQFMIVQLLQCRIKHLESVIAEKIISRFKFKVKKHKLVMQPVFRIGISFDQNILQISIKNGSVFTLYVHK